MSWVYHRRVKYYETDRMGVVHHSNYLRLLEDARLDWFAANIERYGEMERRGIIIPCASASGRFKGFLYYDDPFSVEIWLTEYTGVRMGFSYEVRNEETGELCYEGESVHFFSPDGNKPGLKYGPMSIKHKFPDLHEKLLKLVERK